MSRYLLILLFLTGCSTSGGNLTYFADLENNHQSFDNVTESVIINRCAMKAQDIGPLEKQPYTSISANFCRGVLSTLRNYENQESYHKFYRSQKMTEIAKSDDKRCGRTQMMHIGNAESDDEIFLAGRSYINGTNRMLINASEYGDIKSAVIFGRVVDSFTSQCYKILNTARAWHFR